MIRFVFSLLFSIAMISTSFNKIYAFPENLRKGYTNCASCHVSPTGGGLLTDYGDGASEEFLNTWKLSEEQEASGSDSAFLWGGNLRSLLFTKNDGLYTSKGFIPMQAEGEVAYKFLDYFTADFSAGFYDKDIQARRYYLLANLNEHLYMRLGSFFPAYGILTAEHSIVTRKELGFNQGRESKNIEIGITGETGEIVIDGIISEASDEISAQEKGLTARAAWYAWGKSQIGLSFLSTSSKVWKRTMAGIFIITGLTQSLYLLSELDEEFKKAVDTTEVSTPSNTRLVTYNKLGWEFLPGVHSFFLYENSLNTKGGFNPRLWSYGPGLQWFPLEHFEFMLQAQRKYNSFYPNQPGNLVSLMMHFYF